MNKSFFNGVLALLAFAALAAPAWADVTKRNPAYPNENVTFTYVFRGTDTTYPLNWGTRANWYGGSEGNWTPLANLVNKNAPHTGTYGGGPYKGSGDDTIAEGPYDAALVDGSLIEGGVPTAPITMSFCEGWAVNIGVFGGAKVEINHLSKLQSGGDNQKKLYVGEGSKLTIKAMGSGTVNNDIRFYVAAPEGLVWNCALNNNSNNGTFRYYLAGDGSVKYNAGLNKGTHLIRRCTMEISAAASHKRLVTKTLVAAGTGQTLSRSFSFPEAGDIDLTGESEGVTKTSSTIAAISPDDAVGTYAFWQDSAGVYLTYVDWSETPTPKAEWCGNFPASAAGSTAATSTKGGLTITKNNSGNTATADYMMVKPESNGWPMLVSGLSTKAVSVAIAYTVASDVDGTIVGLGCGTRQNDTRFTFNTKNGDLKLGYRASDGTGSYSRKDLGKAQPTASRVHYAVLTYDGCDESSAGTSLYFDGQKLGTDSGLKEPGTTLNEITLGAVRGPAEIINGIKFHYVAVYTRTLDDEQARGAYERAYETLVGLPPPSGSCDIDSTGTYSLSTLFPDMDSGDDDVINVDTSATLALDVDASAASMTISIAEGETLTLTGEHTLAASTAIVANGGTLAVAGDVTLAGALSGTASVVVNDGGRLTLTDDCTLPLSVESGGTLALAADLTLSGTLSGTGTIALANGVSLRAASIDSGEGTMTVDVSAYDVASLARNAVKGAPYRVWPVKDASITGAVTIDESTMDEPPSGYSCAVISTARGPALEFSTERQFGSLCINFPGGRESNTDNADARVSDNASYKNLMHGAFPVVGTSWNDIPAQNATNVAAARYVRQDGFVSNSGTATVTLAGVNNPYTTGSNEGDRILFGYCDDGSSPQVTISNIPFAKYRVIAYAATDESGKSFCPKTINGVSYSTAAAGSTKTPTLAGATGGWGGSSSRSELAEGVNYLVSEAISGTTTVTIQNPKSSLGRAGIAAVQIVEVGVNPTYDIDEADTYTLGDMFDVVQDGNLYVVNVNESATLNLTANASVGKITFNIAEGKVLTVTGAGAIAASNGIAVNGGKVMLPAPGTLSGTFSGNGVLDYSLSTLPGDLSSSLGSWEGTVRLPEITTGEIKLNYYGVDNSTVDITGFSGNAWLSNSSIPSTINLSGDMVLSGFSSSFPNTIKKLTGSGDFNLSASSSGGYFHLKDVSAFTGSIAVNGPGLAIGGESKPSSSTYGRILLAADTEATVAANKSWTAPNGITNNGTLNLAAGTTISRLRTGSSGRVVATEGVCTVSGVADSAIPGSMTIASGATLKVTDTDITSLTIPADGASTYSNAGTLDLTGCSSMTTLVLNSGASTTFDLSKVSLPTSCTKVVMNAGTVRDLAGYAVAKAESGQEDVTVEYAVEETRPEYGGGSLSVANVPAGATVSVKRADGTTASAPVTDGTARLSDYGEPRISGAATLFDITFANNEADIGKAGGGGGHFTYKAPTASGADLKYDTAASFNNDAWDKSTGVYIKHHPYIDGANSVFYGLSDFTAVVVGQMSPSAKTEFIHFGSSKYSNPGLLIATTDQTDEVVIAATAGSTVRDGEGQCVKVKIPNAATARHAYVITKSGTEFTVYADGIRRGVFTVSEGFKLGTSGHSGMQVGSDFGGFIKDAGNYHYVATDNTQTGVVNVIRVFDYAISEAQSLAVCEEYPYVPQGGLYTRTVEADANLSAADAWEKDGSDARYALPEGATVDAVDYAPSATVTVDAEATLTVNASLALETLTVGGSAALRIESDGEHVLSAPTAVLNTPVTVAYGAVNLAGAVVQFNADGSLCFDCSGLDIGGVYETTRHQLTGVVLEDERFTAILPTAAARTAELRYNGDGKFYELVVTPDHVQGGEVYFNSGYLDGAMTGTGGTGTVYLETGHSHQTILFPGDTMVIDDNSSLYQNQVWVSDRFIGNIKVTRTTPMTLHNGEVTEPILAGKTITVGEGASLTISTHASAALALGALTVNGQGMTLSGPLTLSGAVSGSAPLTVSGTVKGSGSIANAATFADGATVDTTSGTLALSGTVTLGETLNVTVPNDFALAEYSGDAAQKVLGLAASGGLTENAGLTASIAKANGTAVSPAVLLVKADGLYVVQPALPAGEDVPPSAGTVTEDLATEIVRLAAEAKAASVSYKNVENATDNFSADRAILFPESLAVNAEGVVSTAKPTFGIQSLTVKNVSGTNYVIIQAEAHNLADDGDIVLGPGLEEVAAETAASVKTALAEYISEKTSSAEGVTTKWFVLPLPGSTTSYSVKATNE